jgi:hypothetical protein
MIVKVIGSALALVLMAAFCGAAMVKLMDPALIAVGLVGLAMMAVDLWQSLRSKDD